MTSIQDFFETAYSQSSRYWWNVPYAYSTEPDDLAPSLLGQATLRHAHSRPPGKALDVGSGEGADAIRLALLGWQVEALELTAAGSEKIRRTARRLGLDVIVHQGDIREYETNQIYDLVICNGVLHYIADKSLVCEKLQRITATGGANVISLWSDYSPVPACHRIVEVYPDAERGAVVAAYKAWRKELLYFDRVKPEVAHDDMDPHVHSHIKMVAVKEG